MSALLDRFFRKAPKPVEEPTLPAVSSSELFATIEFGATTKLAPLLNRALSAGADYGCTLKHQRQVLTAALSQRDKAGRNIAQIASRRRDKAGIEVYEYLQQILGDDTIIGAILPPELGNGSNSRTKELQQLIQRTGESFADFGFCLASVSRATEMAGCGDAFETRKSKLLHAVATIALVVEEERRNGLLGVVEFP